MGKWREYIYNNSCWANVGNRFLNTYIIVNVSTENGQSWAIMGKKFGQISPVSLFRRAAAVMPAGGHRRWGDLQVEKSEGVIRMIKIEVLGDAVPAARPRFSKGRCYQPKRNAEHRKKLQAAARVAMKGAEPLKGEICAAVKVFRKYRRAARIFGDVDNHLKAIFDGLSGIVFCDDAQICRCVVEKFTDKARPRTEVKISPLKRGELQS